MYFSDHSPAHFHAQYGEYEALVEIETLSILRPMRLRTQRERSSAEDLRDAVALRHHSRDTPVAE
jgi:Domain of unknown function (DUF4160)